MHTLYEHATHAQKNLIRQSSKSGFWNARLVFYIKYSHTFTLGIFSFPPNNYHPYLRSSTQWILTLQINMFNQIKTGDKSPPMHPLCATAMTLKPLQRSTCCCNSKTNPLTEGQMRTKTFGISLDERCRWCGQSVYIIWKPVGEIWRMMSRKDIWSNSSHRILFHKFTVIQSGLINAVIRRIQ